MLLKLAGVLLMVLLQRVEGYDDYEDLTDDSYEEYEGYDDGDDESSTTSYEDSTINRIRRFEAKSPLKTLSQQDVREVRGALKELFSGIVVDNPFTPYTTTPYNDYRPTISSTIRSTTTYYTSPTANTTSSSTPTYISDILTEILKFTESEPTRSKHLRQKLFTILDARRNKPTVLDSQNLGNITEGTTQRTTNKKQELDIPRLLAIISELASEFETNLTRKLNETLSNMTIPTCSTPTPEPPVTSEYDANYTGSIIAKCFVCGLTIPAIPQHAHCADAFAGDFLPLVPVDPTAKGKISRFRKYCKYSNIQGYEYNSTQPRVMLGRWTGGCAVRWIDLSGVYTQRTCRNRMQPTMGKHFASKRMAKLERALWNTENGCIISPMATLVPLSRGISLYARFHACVCTGSWCNPSIANRPWTASIVIMLLLGVG